MMALPCKPRTSGRQILGMFGFMCACLLQSSLGSCYQLLLDMGTGRGRSLALMGAAVLRQNKGKLSLPVYVFLQLFHLQLILF